MWFNTRPIQINFFQSFLHKKPKVPISFFSSSSSVSFFLESGRFVGLHEALLLQDVEPLLHGLLVPDQSLLVFVALGLELQRVKENVSSVVALE